MNGAIMRKADEVHRLLVGCPCGKQFSMPLDGWSYRICRCGRIFEHGWRGPLDHERFLAIHDYQAWERIREDNN